MKRKSPLTVGPIRDALRSLRDDELFEVAIERKLSNANLQQLHNCVRRCARKRAKFAERSPPPVTAELALQIDDISEKEWVEKLMGWADNPNLFWHSLPDATNLCGSGKEKFMQRAWHLQQNKDDLCIKWRFYTVALANAFKKTAEHCEKQVSMLQVESFLRDQCIDKPSKEQIEATQCIIRSGYRRRILYGESYFWLFHDEVSDSLYDSKIQAHRVHS